MPRTITGYQGGAMLRGTDSRYDPGPGTAAGAGHELLLRAPRPSSEPSASKQRDFTLKREQNSRYEHDNGLLQHLMSTDC
jgi:hypothetical protein